MSTTILSPTSQLEEPPYYSGHPLLGAAREIGAAPLALFDRLLADRPDIVRTRMAWIHTYIIFNADYAKHVLQTNHENYTRPTLFSRLMHDVGGENLFSSEGEVWRRQRKMLSPAFHRRRILGFGRIMTEETERLLDEWDQGTFPRDIQAEMTRLTLNIVGRALFSVDMQAAGWGQQLTKGFEGTTGWLNYRFRHIFAPPVFVPTKANRDFVRARATIRRVIGEILAERRQGGGEHDDFLQMLLELRYEDSGEGMTDEQIINEAATFFFAGHETTANSLTWTFYLLAQNPAIESRLRAELATVLNGRSATIDDIPSLPYNRNVIQEGMRLYPAAWATSRQPRHEDQVGPYRIKAGANVFLAIYSIHRNPAYWEKPEQFDPDRFTPERSANRPGHAYLPFGTGPRFCIGSQFAMTEAQIILATIVQRYQLRLLPGYEVEPDTVFTLRVKDSLPMRPA